MTSNNQEEQQDWKTSDLSECNVGDFIFVSGVGYIEIKSRNDLYTQPFMLSNGQCVLVNGKQTDTDTYPIAWPTCPFPDGPEPPFIPVKGQRVLVGLGQDIPALRRIFSHRRDGNIYCFADGKDEWTSQGQVTRWHTIKKSRF